MPPQGCTPVRITPAFPWATCLKCNSQLLMAAPADHGWTCQCGLCSSEWADWCEGQFTWVKRYVALRAEALAAGCPVPPVPQPDPEDQVPVVATAARRRAARPPGWRAVPLSSSATAPAGALRRTGGALRKGAA